MHIGECINIEDAQERIWENKVKKGFSLDNVDQEFCLLYGEVAEAYEAYTSGNKRDLALELANIVIYVMSIWQMNNINLQTALEEKMTINERRTYKTVNGKNDGWEEVEAPEVEE